MLTALVLISLFLALAFLAALVVIDLRDFLLPNALTLPLALTGIVFHTALGFFLLTPQDMALGAATGGGLLLAIRFIANKFYNEDALGLGDVKLLAAGGLWLGTEHTLIALIIGGFAGFLHGAGIAAYQGIQTRSRPDLTRLSIPAGPGFIIGLLAASILKFETLPEILFP